ncbi:MAG: serine/threonine protein kinase [Acidobacteria bacterium]|nr:serine/threonine protein kinase [Acidobacteriota bacterium]
MKQCPECKRAYEDSNSFCVFDGQKLALAEAEDPCIGLVIDNKYRIESKIARGGTGMVYKATHIQLNTPVAIKIIHPHLANDSKAVERFRREALMTMKIRHTNAIAIMDFGTTKFILPKNNIGDIKLNNVEANSVYVVMELLKGMTLEEKLVANGAFSLRETNKIIQQICNALKVAHDHQIVHRDLKPDNIFFHQDESQEIVKLVDFGIARYLGKVDDEEEASRLTQAGFVVGTPFYMSPEQCGGFDVDIRSDIYSLGIIIYRMLTGVLPFDGKKASIIVMKHISEKPKPIYEFKPDLPAIVNGVVMHALSKKPADRPQTVTELAEEIEASIKAVTEQELQKVFMEASEYDLEAALLLTTDPGKSVDLASSVRFTTGQLDTNLGDMSSDTIEAAAAQAGIDNLFQELLRTIRDLNILLTLTQEELEKNNFLDKDTFYELRTQVDQLRGVLFGLHTTYYKAPIS